MQFYIATDGNDAWSGKLPVPNAAGADGPWASPAHARDAIRALKGRGGLDGPVTVSLRGGHLPTGGDVDLHAGGFGADQLCRLPR